MTTTALLPTPALRERRGAPARTATALILAGTALTAWGERLADRRTSTDDGVLRRHAEARRDAQAAAHAGLFR